MFTFPKTEKPIGIKLWQGKSLLNGKKIMVIATGVYDKSKNGKTGEMIQTYILLCGVHPMTARRMGDDYAVCGDCMHREQSTCYVNLCHGPISVFNANLDQSYKNFEAGDLELFRGRSIRIGSYGDPAAVPFEVWDKITSVANKFTGYTHQWDNKKIDQRLKNICMASVDTIKGYDKEYVKAQSMGWCTFRVRESLDNELKDNEFACPASKEGGEKTTCDKCGACSGWTSSTKNSVAIILHADSEALGTWRYNRYMAVMKKRKNKKSWRRDYAKERKIYRATCKF